VKTQRQLGRSETANRPAASHNRGARRFIAGAVLAVLMIATGAPAWGQQSRVYREGRAWVEEITGTMPVARYAKVITDVGNITVQGGGSQSITYTVRKRSFTNSEQEARKQFAMFNVITGKKLEASYLKGDWPPPHNIQRFSADFILQLPNGVEVAYLRTLGGNITANSFNGRVDAETSGGNLVLDNVGIIRASTAGGNVTVGNSSGNVVVRSGGGNIKVSKVNGNLEVETGGGQVNVGSAQTTIVRTSGGNIQVKQSTGDLVASTGGGSVDVGEVYGKASLETSGGSIRLGLAKGLVSARTGSGSIELFKLSHGAQAQTSAGTITAEFVGSKEQFQESYLRTMAGDVRVYLGNWIPVTVHAASEMASGRVGIEAPDFPELKVTTEGVEWGPKSTYCEGTLNGGGPILKVRTTIGKIEFRRAGK
jgi:hypothetical protein